MNIIEMLKEITDNIIKACDEINNIIVIIMESEDDENRRKEKEK